MPFELMIIFVRQKQSFETVVNSSNVVCSPSYWSLSVQAGFATSTLLYISVLLEVLGLRFYYVSVPSVQFLLKTATKNACVLRVHYDAIPSAS